MHVIAAYICLFITNSISWVKADGVLVGQQNEGMTPGKNYPLWKDEILHHLTNNGFPWFLRWSTVWFPSFGHSLPIPAIYAIWVFLKIRDPFRCVVSFWFSLHPNNFSSGHLPILSRDPSFQKTIRTPAKTAGFRTERCLKRMDKESTPRIVPLGGWCFFWLHPNGVFKKHPFSSAGPSIPTSALVGVF